MNTPFLLTAQYGSKAIIPIEDVCRDYFSHLNTTKLVQKISAGEIAIRLVRIDASQAALTKRAPLLFWGPQRVS